MTDNTQTPEDRFRQEAETHLNMTHSKLLIASLGGLVGFVRGYIAARSKSAEELESMEKERDAHKDLVTKWRKVVSNKDKDLAEMEAHYASQGLGLASPYVDKIKQLEAELDKLKKENEELKETSGRLLRRTILNIPDK